MHMKGGGISSNHLYDRFQSKLKSRFDKILDFFSDFKTYDEYSKEYVAPTNIEVAASNIPHPTQID